MHTKKENNIEAYASGISNSGRTVCIKFRLQTSAIMIKSLNTEFLPVTNIEQYPLS